MAHSEESQLKFAIKSEGFFVIIRQEIHNLFYLDGDVVSNWAEDAENFQADENRLREVFKLKGFAENFRVGRNLTNDHEGKAGKHCDHTAEWASFDLFMHSVCKKIKARKPQFIMLFLMSHGFKNGKFLLASQGTQRGPNLFESNGPCCQGQTHTFAGNCYTRDIVEDVVKKVSGVVESEIPKLFIIHACRGSDGRPTRKGKPDEYTHPTADTELFIPGCLNTLVLRASVEGDGAFITGKGSNLIQSFCDALDELKEADKKYELLLQNVKGTSSSKPLAKHLRSPGCRENVTGGWIMNVSQRTSALAANWLFKKTFVPTDEVKNLFGGSVQELTIKVKTDLQGVVNNMKNALLRHNPAWHGEEDIDKVFHWCQSVNKAVEVMTYFMTNVKGATPPYHMNEMAGSEEIENCLDRIIKAWQTVEIYMQQPHISSSLSKKLSLIEILQTQNALGTIPKKKSKCVLL